MKAVTPKPIAKVHPYRFKFDKCILVWCISALYIKRNNKTGFLGQKPSIITLVGGSNIKTWSVWKQCTFGACWCIPMGGFCTNNPGSLALWEQRHTIPFFTNK